MIFEQIKRLGLALLVLGVGGALGGVAALQEGGRNIAPDAISRATIWNSHAGDIGLLTDGRVPGADAGAQAFVWNTKGILVFAWDEAVILHSVRIYVGQVGNNYQIRAYRGGHLEAAGAIRAPEGEQLAIVAADQRLTDQWIDIPIPSDIRADNLEIWTLGPTTFYEIEILVRQATAVKVMGWGQIKARVARTAAE